MEIPNLSSNPSPSPAAKIKSSSPLTLSGVILVLILALAVGFWSSRIFPFSKNSSASTLPPGEKAISAENIKSQEDVKSGQAYGDTNTNFKDSATGTIEKGSINGVGTHILSREGGASQRVSLTSSVLDLDLFVNHKVEVRGETNASKQTGWLMDVGLVKVLE